ncbi:MAG: DUF3110 domain-containing protein [Thermodesulfobacteriota bacterium]|nr:DUF3110 domain-containing protein [Thermodesulfobacteriota bacterium]
MKQNTTDQWFYIVVQNPDTSKEQFMAFQKNDTGATFIPAFSTKEEAQQCFPMMPKDAMHEKYEIQAIIKDDLISVSETSGYVVYLMDHKGSVKEKIT